MTASGLAHLSYKSKLQPVSRVQDTITLSLKVKWKEILYLISPEIEGLDPIEAISKSTVLSLFFVVSRSE